MNVVMGTGRDLRTKCKITTLCDDYTFITRGLMNYLCEFVHGVVRYDIA